MDLNLKGKTALITGATGGIGKAVTEALAKEQVKLVVCSRHESAPKSLAKEIELVSDGSVITVAADLSRIENVRDVIRQTLRNFGKIDILVNSFASAVFGDFLTITEESWRSVIDTKYFGYLWCMREVIPHMTSQHDGRIVNISGLGGFEPQSVHLPGSSVNAAINLLTKGLARDVGRHSVRINSVVPGPVETSKLGQVMKCKAKELGVSLDRVQKDYFDDIPLRRYARPQEIPDLVVFLVSDRASDLTGQCVLIDGGITKSL